MYFLRTEASFDSAHFLKNYEGKCRNIHGHRWRVIAEISGDTLETKGPKRGMVIDFGDFKKVLKELCDTLDHSLIIEKGSLKQKTLGAIFEEAFRIIEVPFVPTAENFAKYFFEQLQKSNLQVHRVEVYETPNNFAAYEE